MLKIELAYYLCSLVERNSENKIINKIAFHPSFNRFYHPYMCVDIVTTIVEYESMS